MAKETEVSQATKEEETEELAEMPEEELVTEEAVKEQHGKDDDRMNFLA